VLSRFLVAVLVGSVLVPGASRADESGRFRLLSVGVSGGFQSWSLDGLEETLADRADQFGEQGFLLGPGDFGVTYSYGVEIQVRLTELFFARAQADWTRLKWDDRDRQSLAELGAPSRDGFSLAYESRVKTRPLMYAVGAGVARELTSIRVGLSGSLLIAPVEVEDNIVLARGQSETETNLTSSGTGTGFGLNLGIDWFTEVNTNLFVDLFWRTGSTTVALDQADWESSLVPGKRRVDLDATGIRVGFRWI
jgi:hypothetical protein